MTNVVYICNQCPTRALPTIILEEAWSGRRPCIIHMYVFRCIVYVMVFDETKGKFDVKSSKCLFGGYCKDTKAHRLMCLRTNNI